MGTSINVDSPYGFIGATDSDLAFALLELLAFEARKTEADLIEAVTLDLS